MSSARSNSNLTSSELKVDSHLNRIVTFQSDLDDLDPYQDHFDNKAAEWTINDAVAVSDDS